MYVCVECALVCVQNRQQDKGVEVITVCVFTFCTFSLSLYHVSSQLVPRLLQVEQHSPISPSVGPALSFSYRNSTLDSIQFNLLDSPIISKVI